MLRKPRTQVVLAATGGLALLAASVVAVAGHPVFADDQPPGLRTLTGTLLRCGSEHCLDGTQLNFGPMWWAERTEAEHDYDDDGRRERVAGEVAGLVGEEVVLEVEDDDRRRVDVYTVNGLPFRDTAGGPAPWQARPDEDPPNPARHEPDDPARREAEPAASRPAADPPPATPDPAASAFPAEVLPPPPASVAPSAVAPEERRPAPGSSAPPPPSGATNPAPPLPAHGGRSAQAGPGTPEGGPPPHAAVHRDRPAGPGREPPPLSTLEGTLERCGDSYCVEETVADFGPVWFLERTDASEDYDGDGTTESMAAELRGLVGTEVTLEVESGPDDADVFTINGRRYRDRHDVPPWAGGPLR